MIKRAKSIDISGNVTWENIVGLNPDYIYSKRIDARPNFNDICMTTEHDFQERDKYYDSLNDIATVHVNLSESSLNCFRMGNLVLFKMQMTFAEDLLGDTPLLTLKKGWRPIGQLDDYLIGVGWRLGSTAIRPCKLNSNGELSLSAHCSTGETMLIEIRYVSELPGIQEGIYA